MKVVKKAVGPLVDIQNLSNQANPASELARTLAASDTPANALKEINRSMKASTDHMKSIESASDLARRLAHSDPAARLSEGVPKINLNLPDISATIKASLPKQLPDVSAGPVIYSPIAMPNKRSETVTQADVRLDSIEDLGQMVRRVRERRKLSQQAFADLAGVGRRFVSELENGKPTLEFAKVLQVTHAAGIALIARDRSL